MSACLTREHVQALKNGRVVVYACARSSSTSAALEECKRQYGKRLHLVTLDVANLSSIQVGVSQPHFDLISIIGRSCTLISAFLFWQLLQLLQHLTG